MCRPEFVGSDSWLKLGERSVGDDSEDDNDDDNKHLPDGTMLTILNF